MFLAGLAGDTGGAVSAVLVGHDDLGPSQRSGSENIEVIW
jgi:hypothetical protein